MNGEKAHAYSEGIRGRGGYLVSDHHSMAERAAAARGRAEATGRSTNRGRQAESLANSGLAGREGSETGSQAETWMEERTQAEAGARFRDQV